MRALPEKGTRRIFKRALIGFFCSELKEGQPWSLYNEGEARDKVIIIREVQPDKVHFTLGNDWGWFTLREFVDRRIDGRIRPFSDAT